MRYPFLSGSAFAIIGALALWSCGGGSAPTAPAAAATAAVTTSPAGPATVTVSIVGSVGNTAYRPNPIAANSGDTVTFKNDDSTAHHIVMDDGSADFGEVGPGGTSTGFTLKNGNATNFHCVIHSSMVGSINGATAPTPPPCNDPYGYSC